MSGNKELWFRRWLIPLLIAAICGAAGGCNTPLEIPESELSIENTAKSAKALTSGGEETGEQSFETDVRLRWAGERVEVVITCEKGFSITGSGTQLFVGSKRFTGSYFPPKTNYDIIVFPIAKSVFDSLNDGDPIMVSGCWPNGPGNPLATLNKSQIEEE